MEFLQLIQSISAALNSSNVSECITLTENLISLGESIFEHKAPANAVVAPVIAAPAPVVPAVQPVVAPVNAAA